ncbi:hypothetical protein [Cohnella hashimotonis]|uniref:Amidohydrolase n=1 Tax=Cohnella hashimotonis TaxID=2826895 RepID=A0ABT6TFS0_9BACL|nr:hypothetical protein [Cohnella hashimotonis]MDI4645145.1 hypothetical protein [Cohnella hashimotonis]
MIIDAHAHLGWDYVFDEDFTLQEQLDKHAKFGIEATILQPASCHDIEAVKEQHDRCSNLSGTKSALEGCRI